MDQSNWASYKLEIWQRFFQSFLLYVFENKPQKCDTS